MATRPGDVEVNVGRIGRAHGVRGEVSVTPRTDDVDRRFAAGAVLAVDDTGEPSDAVPGGVADAAPPLGRPRAPRILTVADHRWHAGRLLVRFAGVADRTAAEGLRGLLLTCTVPADERPDDEDEYYDRQLVGLRVLDAAGADRGRVAEVLHLPAQDVLEIDAPTGRRLVPFVNALVPTVDLAAGLVRLADVAGLLEDADETTPSPQGASEPGEP